MTTNSRVAAARMATLAALWASSLFLMAQGTFEPGRGWIWMCWGLWTGLVALAPTAWWITDAQCRRQRVRVEHLARIMAEECDDDREAGSVARLR